MDLADIVKFYERRGGGLVTGWNSGLDSYYVYTVLFIVLVIWEYLNKKT